MIPLRDNNPTKSFPIFTLLLIAANIFIFLYQMSLGPAMEPFVMQLAAVPYEIMHLRDISPKTDVPIAATLLTSMFVHGNLLHLGGNMLYLWIFGDNIEDSLGHLRFILFYFICGLIATFTHIITGPNSTTPIVGASGAIAGVLGAYLLLYPRAKVDTLFILIIFIKIIRIPAFILLTLWFVLQVLNSTEGGSVAWYAHIGGFIAGFLLVKPLRKKK
ncbi:MAG: rhomboid family intramembrane serine protease [Proteobacteria bacterium]|nr:rhomboid family intramembrane serine protease [Pseudomonadota bacterium]